MFAGRIKRIRRNRQGRIVWKKESVNGKKVPQYDTRTRTKGCVNPKFKKKDKKLLSKLLPHEIADIFLPLHRKGKGLFPLDDEPTNSKVPKWRWGFSDCM